MGLYIKDLDLPGAIEPELVMDFAVGLDGKVYARYYHHREGGLTDWKEVISIPDHGDLIDRDAARGSIKPWSPEDERNGCTFDTVKKLMHTMLDRAPTIIPAEEGEG